MSRSIDAVLEFVFSVAGLTMAFAFAIVVCWRWPARRRLRVFVVSVATIVVAASVPAVPRGVIGVYAGYRPFERADLPDATVVVVLGAGSTAVPGRAVHLDILEPVGAGRVLEAARVYFVLDRPLIISSGGATGDQPPSARVMRDALLTLGVPADRIREEDRSQTTAEEAKLIAPLLRELRVRALVLVTSASHMPRAAAVFRAQGFSVVPAAAGDYPKRRRHAFDARIWPSHEGWLLTRAVVHEWLGLLYYRLRGWRGDVRDD